MLSPRFSNAGVVVPRSGAAQIIAIGASTGGTVALESLLRRLPADVPPIVIVQHTLQGFVRPFAARLESVCPLRVTEAANGDVAQSGTAWVAPAEAHLKIVRQGGQLRALLTDTPPVHFHRPSVDVLFHSLVPVARSVDVVAVLLTGMGQDGAEGLLALHRAGAHTIAQDEESSVIFGMPKAAIARGAARYIVSLDDLPGRILSCLDNNRRSERAVLR